MFIEDSAAGTYIPSPHLPMAWRREIVLLIVVSLAALAQAQQCCTPAQVRKKRACSFQGLCPRSAVGCPLMTDFVEILADNDPYLHSSIFLSGPLVLRR